MTPNWEHFPHEAGMGVRGIGPTKEAAFEGAALAITAVITDLAEVIPMQQVTIACEAPDDELLLVAWLNALVYEMATRKMLFSRFNVRVNDHSLDATARGEPVEVIRHRLAVEVKGGPARISSSSRARRGTGSRSAWWMCSPRSL